MFLIPWSVSNASDFVNAILDWSGVQELELIFGVTQRYFPWVVSVLLASSYLEDHIKVRWCVLTPFWEKWHLLRLEVILWEFPQSIDTVYNRSIFIVNADVVINWVIPGLFRSSGKESEFGLQWVERLFATKFTILVFKDIVLQKKNISDGQVSWIVLNILGKEEYKQLLLTVNAWVDHFYFHAIVSFDIFSVGIGSINNHSNSWKLLVNCYLCSDFLERLDCNLIWHSDEIFNILLHAPV